MPDCMREIASRGLRTAVLEAARNKPFLGICIGQQMLFEHSDEGDVPGLGLIAGGVHRFPAEKMIDATGKKLKVPHMGWNEVRQAREHRCGKALPTMRASISCTATSSNHSTPPASPVPPTTASPLPVR
jgi:glutamine amidotransferase